MKKPFKDLRIIGVFNDRCYVIEGSILRIFFRLSGNPPKGWSYWFSTVWQTVQYPTKRPAGVEEDAIWIECAPEDVRKHHLEQLERAVAQANANYRSFQRRRAMAEQQQAKLNSQSRAQLEELDHSLNPGTHSNMQTKSGLRFGTVLEFLRRLRGAPTKKD